METFNFFRAPQAIIYGRNAFKEIGNQATQFGKKALIVSDEIIDQLGFVRISQEMLSENDVESVVYLGVKSEPTDKFVEESLELFRVENCDLVISLGGGSCIDTAKAVAVLATNYGYIGDYMNGGKAADVTPVPHIAIPTTAGTGSEATDVTVITNTSNNVKMMIKQPAFMPSVAIVDPILTMPSPQHVTAATGVDALSHAIEAYISRKSHPMTDVLALSAMKLIVHNLVAAYEDGENIDAREAMSLGALQAGIAFSNASVCLVHGMSRPIGALFHVPHGFSNAMLLPAVLEFSKDSCIERLADLGRIFEPDKSLTDEVAAKVAVAAVKHLCKVLNIPNLKEWGIDKQKFDSFISKMASDAITSGSPGNNPKVPSREEIEELYQVCFDYDFGYVSAK
ncbi:iron-containing alcohol dehydrogenase [Paenibacillus sp. BSR1-1]|uniref:iron-containing alcohol dehydrogenase n=1 Tax=Paenibacillus sp. BSR1-1 TaxID=3020845 RepID=UPI0025B24E64|nr:iron-containing alcohol dehydrogenase [Paenibacillus sp. BSR1-1]MDN3015508.1 iron-containing alcohol dehydrogenase [Paenibacillus sp. BSR1-1]